MVGFLSNIEEQNVTDGDPRIQGLALERCITLHVGNPDLPVYV
jgi:hypothetical protein